MINQITRYHLKFVQEAKEAFEKVPYAETYTNTDETLIALRMGMDRDCILVYELGDEIANFVQQIEPKPSPRKVVRQFAYVMEDQLKVNDHKGGWNDAHHEFLFKYVAKNFYHLTKELRKEDIDKEEITKRCANIANFIMMVADNYGTVREEN